MTIRHKFRAMLVAAAVMAIPCQAMAGGTALHYPVIKQFGGAYALTNAAEQPDPNKAYKVIFDVTKGAPKPSKVNAGLFHVAKAVNIMTTAGVPLSNLHFVAVLHGKATVAVLDNAHYKAKFGINNPNIPLFKALREAGVRVDVCGQSMLKEHYQLDWANRYVTPALSALSTLIIYGNQGYAYVKQ